MFMLPSRLPNIDLNKWFNLALRTIKANKTTIYAAGASAGVVATGVTCARAAIKSKEYEDEYSEATLKEKVKYHAGVWIMPVVVGGVTIFCIWRGHKIHLEKEASLAAMSAFWQKKYENLEAKVSEKLGEEGYQEIKEEILKDKVANKTLPSVNLNPGEFWVYDEYSDQFIRTNAQRFNWALYSINQKFSAMRDVEYNWFLSLIGGHQDPKLKNVGWSFDNEDQIECMGSTGLGYWIEITPDYYTIESSNKEKDGVLAATLFFNYYPEPFLPWEKR